MAEKDEIRLLREVFATLRKQAPEERTHQFKMKTINAIVILSVAVLSVYLAATKTVSGEAVIGLFGTLFGYWLRGN